MGNLPVTARARHGRRALSACIRALCGAIALTLPIGALAAPTALPNPIMFVTQMPIPDDFATIGSVFANHRGGINLSGRGGDLYIRYPDGALRNLTQEAG